MQPRDNQPSSARRDVGGGVMTAPTGETYPARPLASGAGKPDARAQGHYYGPRPQRGGGDGFRRPAPQLGGARCETLATVQHPDGWESQYSIVRSTGEKPPALGVRRLNENGEARQRFLVADDDGLAELARAIALVQAERTRFQGER